MGKPVSFANCSLMCLVGFGVDEKADLRISNCFAFMVVLGPRLFDPALPSPLPPPAPPSGLLFSVWLSLVSGSPSREPWADADKCCLIIDLRVGVKIRWWCEQATLHYYNNSMSSGCKSQGNRLGTILSIVPVWGLRGNQSFSAEQTITFSG